MNKAIDFFGISNEYIINVQKKEIFSLVTNGFDYSSLMKMSVAERRFYFNLLLQRAQEMKNAREMDNSADGKIIFNPLK